MSTLRKTVQQNDEDNNDTPKVYNTRQCKSKNNKQGDRVQPYQRPDRLSNSQKQCQQSLSKQQNFADKQDSQESSQDMSVTENKTPLKPEVNLEKKEDASQPTVELSQDKVSQSQAKQEIKSEVSDEQKGGLNEAMDTGDTDSKEVQGNLVENGQISTTCNNGEINNENEVQTKSVNGFNSKVSATTKALKKFDRKLEENKKLKKTSKVSVSVRRRNLNNRLSKVLTPKSALILLNELKPGCTYKIQEQPASNPVQFMTQVEYKGEVLGVGQGMSKAHSKTLAAENAIKLIVSKRLTQTFSSPNQNTKDDANENSKESSNDSAQDLPWTGLASFALFKLFTEWQNQGTEFPFARPTKSKAGSKPKASVKSHAGKELPPNAAELHPTTVLNIMRPGLTAVELQRETGPNPRVTMGYVIDGQTYTGVGNNKKGAKKEAAKAAVSSLWGVKYAEVA